MSRRSDTIEGEDFGGRARGKELADDFDVEMESRAGGRGKGKNKKRRRDSAEEEGREPKREQNTSETEIFSHLSLEKQKEVLDTFIAVLREFDQAEVVGQETNADPKTAENVVSSEVVNEDEVLDPSKIEFYQALATRESVEDPKKIAGLVAEVAQMMGREARERKSGFVELSAERPTMVISEVNGNRSALVNFLDASAFGRWEIFNSEEYKGKTCLDLLREGKINLVFTGNYTHMIGAVARERQGRADKLMHGSGSEKAQRKMLDNPFQNAVMSDALNCLQMVLSLKKQFPKNITLLANSYELLLDRHLRGMETDVSGINENVAYVEWLKEYFGPNSKNVDRNISQMMFEKMHFPVLAIVRDAGVVISPSLPTSYRTSRQRKPSVEPSAVISALHHSEPAAVDAMCANKDEDLKKTEAYAAALGIENPVIWVAAGGKNFYGGDIEGADVVNASGNEQTHMIRLNNLEGVLGGYILSNDSKTGDVSSEQLVIMGDSGPKKEVSRVDIFEKHA